MPRSHLAPLFPVRASFHGVLAALALGLACTTSKTTDDDAAERGSTGEASGSSGSSSKSPADDDEDEDDEEDGSTTMAVSTTSSGRGDDGDTGGADAGAADTDDTDTAPDGPETDTDPGVVSDACDPPRPQGDYADCVRVGNDACGVEAAGCFTTNGRDLSVCVFECTEACDCPVAAAGTAVSGCDDLGGAAPECFLDCGDDRTCPDDMECVTLQGDTPEQEDLFMCMFRGTPPPPVLYGNPEQGCQGDAERGVPVGPGIVCAEACIADTDCPAPPASGDATPFCLPFSPVEGDCLLDCQAGVLSCPHPGMVCLQGGGGLSACVFPPSSD